MRGDAKSDDFASRNDSLFAPRGHVKRCLRSIHRFHVASGYFRRLWDFAADETLLFLWEKSLYLSAVIVTSQFQNQDRSCKDPFANAFIVALPVETTWSANDELGVVATCHLRLDGYL